MKIFSINSNSKYLSEVKKLWRTNSATLGFFPDGAFFDYADKRQILVAVTESDSLIGYLIYRVTKQRISIVHLCVDSSARKQGIAKLLVDFLKQNTKNSYGIGLYCRRDFEANKILLTAMIKSS
jgi:ribosomal protein S18 acetylase RimI-like enzyme